MTTQQPTGLIPKAVIELLPADGKRPLTAANLETLGYIVNGKFDAKKLAPKLHLTENAVYTRRNELLKRVDVEDEVQFGRLYEYLGIACRNIDDIEEGLETARDLRIVGGPRSALKALKRLRQSTKNQLATAPREVLRGRLCHLDALILNEQGRIYREIYDAEEAYNESKKVAGDLLKVYDFGESKNKEIIGLYDFCVADATYILRNPDGAIRYALKALKQVKIPEFRLCLYRILAISYSMLATKQEFKNGEWENLRQKIHHGCEEMTKLIEGGRVANMDDVCQAHEGMARAMAGIKDDAGWSHIEQGYALLKVMEENYDTAPLRRVQLVRGQLIVAMQLLPAGDSTLRPLGEEGIRLATGRYGRQAEQIRSLLNEMGD